MRTQTSEALWPTGASIEQGLSVKEKELIALALSSASKCSKCFTYHSDRAREEGASDKEILETMEVVAYMVGPSGLIWSDLIDEAVDYFEKE